MTLILVLLACTTPGDSAAPVPESDSTSTVETDSTPEPDSASGTDTAFPSQPEAAEVACPDGVGLTDWPSTIVVPFTWTSAGCGELVSTVCSPGVSVNVSLVDGVADVEATAEKGTPSGSAYCTLLWAAGLRTAEQSLVAFVP